MINLRYLLIPLGGVSIILAACNIQAPPTPDFSVISSPQAPALAQATATPRPTDTPTSEPTAEPEQAHTDTNGVAVFEMATVSPTPVVPTETPTDTPPPPVIPTDTPAATPTPPPPPTATPKPVTPPDEPRQGGSWDLEDGFAVWHNPYGDDCSGSKVAVGWQGFTSRGAYGSSCFYLNEFGPNVFSGRYSQEITFDFVDAHAGLYRTFDSQPGHQYQITARLKHVHTLPPMQYHFGVDLTGGNSWEAETVQWVSWDEFREGEWITHEESFIATGPQTTFYIKGFHDTASQGGATYVDAIEVIDLGTP